MWFHSLEPDTTRAAELERFGEINQHQLTSSHSLCTSWTRLWLQSALQSPHHASSVRPSGGKIPSAPPAASSAASSLINKTQLLSWLKLSLQRSKSNQANVAICCMSCSVCYQICEDFTDDLSCFNFCVSGVIQHLNAPCSQLLKRSLRERSAASVHTRAHWSCRRDGRVRPTNQGFRKLLNVKFWTGE